MDKQTIMHAGSVTARMLAAKRAAHFIKLIVGKEAFCMGVRLLFYIGPGVLFSIPSIASRSRTNTRTNYFEVTELQDKGYHRSL